MSIKVLKPGLATSVQDAGREGHYHLGIPPSGALDQYALRAANLLVGNAPTAAVLECALLGPRWSSSATPWWPCAGAHDASPGGRGDAAGYFLPGSRRPGPGVRLHPCRRPWLSRHRRRHRGTRGAGQPFDLRSGAIGGLQGRRLAEGDLPLGPASPSAVEGLALPRSLQVEVGGEVSLRVVPGLYVHRLTPDAVERFFAETWTVGSEADRTGYRFKGGTAFRFEPREQPFGAGSDPSNIVDACYPIGSIQVPGGLEPIVLHRDAVSGGDMPRWAR